METIIQCNIIADQPTANLNIYPKKVLEDAVAAFNAKAAVNVVHGGILNRSKIEDISNPTHIVKSMFINSSGVLCAKIEFLNDPFEGSLVGRPVMAIPWSDSDHIESKDRDPFIVDKISGILTVQVEHGDSSGKTQ